VRARQRAGIVSSVARVDPRRRPHLQLRALSDTRVKRRRLVGFGEVYLLGSYVGRMHIDGTLLSNRQVVGVVRQPHHNEHPLGHAVPERLLMRKRGEPKLRMHLKDGCVIEFYIASTLFGMLLDGVCISAPEDGAKKDET